jgi:hypothetical protein
LLRCLQPLQGQQLLLLCCQCCILPTRCLQAPLLLLLQKQVLLGHATPSSSEQVLVLHCSLLK